MSHLRRSHGRHVCVTHDGNLEFTFNTRRHEILPHQNALQGGQTYGRTRRHDDSIKYGKQAIILFVSTHCLKPSFLFEYLLADAQIHGDAWNYSCVYTLRCNLCIWYSVVGYHVYNFHKPRSKCQVLNHFQNLEFIGNEMIVLQTVCDSP